MSETTGQTPLDNFHSDELRAELARRGAITEEAVQLYKNLTQSTDMPQVPCPYGDKGTVDLAYYLSHAADMHAHNNMADEAKLFQAAAEWVRSKGSSETHAPHPPTNLSYQTTHTNHPSMYIINP